jgi:hypothetical protein
VCLQFRSDLIWIGTKVGKKSLKVAIVERSGGNLPRSELGLYSTEYQVKV